MALTVCTLGKKLCYSCVGEVLQRLGADAGDDCEVGLVVVVLNSTCQPRHSNIVIYPDDDFYE
jgi:hypothetical protein